MFTSRLRGFRSLSSDDLRWPLTSTKNNRVLPLNMTNLYTKYEKCRSLLSWDIVFTSHFRHFRNFTAGDLKWPLTFAKNNRVLLLNMTNPCAKYENYRSLLTWDIVFTRFFGFWPLVTSNDLWPAPKTIGFFLSTWQSYIPNMKSVGHTYLEISCLQAKCHKHTYTRTPTHDITII